MIRLHDRIAAQDAGSQPSNFQVITWQHPWL